jgi:integrase
VPGSRPASCGACLAWGRGFNNGLCKPCYDYAHRWAVGECGSCRRRLPVNKGHCRLCWCQARVDRSAARDGAIGTYTALLPYAVQVRHQQLFLAEMPAPRDLVGKRHARRRGVGVGAPGIARKPPPPPAGRPPAAAWQQLPLFDRPPRVYRFGRYDLRRQPVPDNPWLRWALHLAHTMAEARGWDEVVLGAVNRSLVLLLAEHTDGDVVDVTEFAAELRRRCHSIEHTSEVLAAMGILRDERRPTLHRWLDGKLTGLPSGLRNPVEEWARLMHDGGPRTQARSPLTVRVYVMALRPILLDWSCHRGHLREITRDDVLAQIGRLHGHQRMSALVALRSLFGWAKKTGIVFRNSTARITVSRVEYSLPTPLTPEELTSTIEVADKPHVRVAVALAAVHAARHGEIIGMQLSDVDLGDRRLTIAGRDRPLDDLTRRVITDWLDYRRTRWPNTANPHLLLSRESALRLGPVSHPWLNRILRGLPAGLERLRVDRYLDEAITSGADPLQVAEVFGVCESTAVRYAAAARQLLPADVEAADVEPGAQPPTS